VREPDDFIEALFVGRIVAQSDGDFDMLSTRYRERMKALQREVDFTRCDGQPHFPKLKLHGAKILGGMERFNGGKLFGVGHRAFTRGIAVADLLLGKHPGDQKHAKTGPQCELRADGKIEAGHKRITGDPPTINAGG
jgi:hypothetical protein